MRIEDQLSCARRLFEHVEADSTDMLDEPYLHNLSDYTSVEQLKLERKHLFRGFPLFIGFSSEVAEPGSYKAGVYDGVPVLVSRAQDGRLKAFLNMCSHRAAPVVEEGCGSRRRFVCPYHGWTYDGDGKLCGMSMKEGFPCQEQRGLDLEPLPVQEKYGLIWIGLNPSLSFDVDELLGDFREDFKAYPFESYVHYKTIEMKKNMNWKMVIDTFLENYHLRVLHRNTIGDAILSHVQLVDPSGVCERLIQARKSFASTIKSKPEAEWDFIKHTAITYVLFPNTFFIMQSDHVEIWRSYPDKDNPGASIICFDVYIPEPATTEKARNYWDKNINYGIAIVLDEDFTLGERSQGAFMSGVREHITFGRNEPGLVHYHKAIKRSIGYPE